jgi:predicted permease
VFEIVGIGPKDFTGTEPGTVIGIFLPTMMHAGVTHSDWSWFRTLVVLKPGITAETVVERLRPPFRAFREEWAKSVTDIPRQLLERFLTERLLLDPAASGISGMQKDYRRSLNALGVLVTLVLLIACANVANLMTAHGAARAREMALRVSIGAGRWRLVQLVLMESALVAVLAAAIGALFAWWSAPFVVHMIDTPDNPARLLLPADWRVFGFGLALTLAVTALFGVVPALRASTVRPASALKGGEEPHSRRRLMHTLVATQIAFCFLVLFVAGLFVATFDRLSNQPTGYTSERILALDTVSPASESVVTWEQAAEHLRSVPGVEKVALAGWPLLDGNGWNGFISVHDAPPTGPLAYFLNVSPGWLDTMKIALLDGRDLRPGDTFPGTALINQAFAKRYFAGENPLGKWFEKPVGTGDRIRCQIVGVVADARYRNMREPITPTAYVPMQAKRRATFLIRTVSANPLAMAGVLRQEVPRAQPKFRVSNIRTQTGINQAHTIRERLLAMLALFFATVALLLAGVGLYGVLDYSVLQRRREIGIRMAIGAQPARIVRLVTTDIFSMVVVGALAGLLLGAALVRYIETLFYQVKPTDAAMLGFPMMTIVVAAVLAAIPAVVHAVRIDPVQMLRAE